MAVDVPFSKRFENIMKLTVFCAKQSQTSSDAKARATEIEQECLSKAQSAADYQKLCDDQIFSAEQHDSVLNRDLEEENVQEEIFNTDGPTFGKYKWATFYADGITSSVYKARPAIAEAATKVVALKVMHEDHLQPPHQARKEARVLQRFKADSIVPLLDSFQQPGGKLVLVFPFLRQDLENLLRTDTLSKRQSAMVFAALFSALSHLHAQGIIHRDIKPSNILLQSKDGPVYLIDFGIAWVPNDPDSEPTDRKITDVGTTSYRPPELLFGHRAYGTSLDMWATGCVVAEMVSKGHHQLFDAGPLGSELALIKSMFSTLGTPSDEDWPSASTYPDWGKFRFQQFPAKESKEILPGASNAAIDFVRSTVCYEPTKRLSAAAALKHSLLEGMSRP